jgi:glycine hydroxymethyltransferase
MSEAAAKLQDLPLGFFSRSLAEADPAVFAAVKGELARQREQIELIASENIVSRAVLEAAGSVLTNKYAEGYPGRRYYGGCEEVDKAEKLAIDRACKLFDCSFANVQPHSGAQANQAAFMALLARDTFLGMALDQAAPHARLARQPGKWFKVVSYGVKPDTHLIDYEQMKPARKDKPDRRRPAYSRQIDWARFRKWPTRRLLHGRHGALCRSGCRRRLSQPAAARPRRHYDHYKTLRGRAAA